MERERGATGSQVSDESMPASNRVSRGSLLEPTHGVQALFEMSMVALDAVVEVL